MTEYYRHNSDSSTITETITNRSWTTARILNRRRSGSRDLFTCRCWPPCFAHRPLRCPTEEIGRAFA